MASISYSSPEIPEETVTRLKSLYQDNPIAKLILDYFTTYAPEEEPITADELEYVFREKNITRPNISNVLKCLEELDLGVYKIGRRGQPTRFESEHYFLVDIGKAAVETNQALDNSQQKVELDTENDQEYKATSLKTKEDSLNDKNGSNDLVRYPFRLRTGLIANLELPVNLTRNEAKRLCDFIASFPIEE